MPWLRLRGVAPQTDSQVCNGVSITPLHEQSANASKNCIFTGNLRIQKIYTDMHRMNRIHKRGY